MWINPEGIMLSEVSQAQKANATRNYMIIHETEETDL
jgi:hypothetical protein